MDTQQPNTLGKILDAAEQRIRCYGYNGFSFRDIAADVGIKSASVHYHFPTKGDLGAAVMQRYSQRFCDAIGAAEDERVPAEELLARYVAGYQALLAKDNALCLGGILTAESASLPEELVQQVRRFFETQTDWLKTVYQRLHPKDKKKKSRVRAQQLLAQLHGGLLVARATADEKLFERICNLAVK